MPSRSHLSVPLAHCRASKEYNPIHSPSLPSSPPRCIFGLSICRRCVEDMDHHCPWVNTCVGRRNRKYFILFVVYTSVLCMYTLALLLRVAIVCNKGGSGWPGGCPWSAALVKSLTLWRVPLWSFEKRPLLYDTRLYRPLKNALCSSTRAFIVF